MLLISSLLTLKNTFFPISFNIQKNKHQLFSDSSHEKIVFCYDVVNNSEKVAILLHGWFGSYNSPIINRYALWLKKQGISVVKINLKDHGDTCKLNKSLFSFAEVSYVEEIVEHIIKISGKKIIIIGLSLGANFILRMHNLTNLSSHIVCLILITPVFDIKKALQKVDKTLIYKFILMNNIKRMLKKKQRAYPGCYDFNQILYNNSTNIGFINSLMPYYGFDTQDEYLKQCSINQKNIDNLNIRTLLIITKDDPIISNDNINYLIPNIVSNHFVSLVTKKYGGHCLFYDKILNFILE
ncbi:MAG: alpha/beta hydrolase [Clostridioides sp.]|jgi:predicted alpha/beta-fold hydrolase|nr:alpha/beta hydrolase [Clostridioides sp.]